MEKTRKNPQKKRERKYSLFTQKTSAAAATTNNEKKTIAYQCGC